MRPNALYRYPRERWLFGAGVYVGLAFGPWAPGWLEALLTPILGPPSIPVPVLCTVAAVGLFMAVMIYIAKRDLEEEARNK